MPHDQLSDPFDDDNALESFDLLDDEGQYPDSDDEQNPDSQFSDEQSDDGVESVASAPEKSSKAAVAASNDQPKAFIKTPLGIACLAGCVVMLGVVGVGASGVFSSSAPVEIAQNSEIPAPSEPAAFGNKVGLTDNQADLAQAQSLLPSAVTPATAVAGVMEAQRAVVANPNPILQSIQGSGSSIQPAAPAHQDAPIAVESSKDIAELRDSLAELQLQTKAISGLVVDVRSAIDRLNRQQNELAADVKSIRTDIAKMTTVVQPSEAAAVKAAEKPVEKVSAQPAPAKPASITDGRSRLAGLQVIDTSQNGEMSIIKKASNGRIFTLYPDEVINWAGSRHKVTGIEKEGSIVLVGDKYFIDKVLEAPKAQAKPEPKPAYKAKAPRESTPTSAANAKGFTLNAVYDSNRSFGVVNDKGEFKSYKIGDTIDKLGTVIGLTPKGDLKVGNTIIQSVY